MWSTPARAATSHDHLPTADDLLGDLRGEVRISSSDLRTSLRMQDPPRGSRASVFSELMFEVQLDQMDANAQRGLNSSALRSRQFSREQGLILDDDQMDAHAQTSQAGKGASSGSRLVSSVQGRVENQRFTRSESAMRE